MSKFYVYVHSRLNTGEPFYVGKGCAYRWASRHTRTAHWRNIVAKDGGFHNSFIARDLDEDLAFLVEVEMIDKLRRLGVRLANASNGGEGPSGMKLSDETKKKLSIINVGRKHSAETRAKMSEARVGKSGLWMRGRTPSAETRLKLSVAGVGRISTAVTKQKLRDNFLGRPLDEATKQKISEALRGRVSPKKGRPGKPHSEETRRRMSEAHLGRKPSPESIEKLRESQRVRWAKRKQMLELVLEKFSS